MKSLVEEASSVAKAIEKAWNRAGNPQTFSVKIFENPETNFFGFVKKSAKVGIFYEEEQAAPVRKQGPQNRDQRERAPRTREHGSRENTGSGERAPFVKSGERAPQREGSSRSNQQRQRPEQRQPRAPQVQNLEQEQTPYVARQTQPEPSFTHERVSTERQEVRHEPRHESRYENRSEISREPRHEERSENHREFRSEGRSEGTREPRSENRSEGAREPRSEGRSEGRYEGRSEGRSEGGRERRQHSSRGGDRDRGPRRDRNDRNDRDRGPRPERREYRPMDQEGSEQTTPQQSSAPVQTSIVPTVAPVQKKVLKVSGRRYSAPHSEAQPVETSRNQESTSSQSDDHKE